jgi:hypothetical protein
VIPRNVQFIDSSAFINASISSISIESGNELFVIENQFLIDIVHHRLIRNFSGSSNIEIGSDIEILGLFCFSHCNSLSSISFKSNSLLTQIESLAFYKSSLQSILIPRNVEILGSSCFSLSKSLSSISFESNSRLIRFECRAFHELDIVVVIPSTVMFLACDAFDNVSRISIADDAFCHEFDRWRG